MENSTFSKIDRRIPTGVQDGEIEIFLVDDHPAIRRVFASMARDASGVNLVGYSPNAEEALSEIEEQNPDVAIIDVRLDGTSGITLTQEIRSCCPQTRVLIFSMYDESIYAERAIRAGASGYLTKDKSIDEIKEAVTAISEGHIYLKQSVLIELLNQTVWKADGAGQPGLEALTQREMTVFRMMGNGKSADQIATQLNLSRKTVESHRRQAKEKLGCESVHQLLRRAVLWRIEREDERRRGKAETQN